MFHGVQWCFAVWCDDVFIWWCSIVRHDDVWWGMTGLWWIMVFYVAPCHSVVGCCMVYRILWCFVMRYYDVGHVVMFNGGRWHLSHGIFSISDILNQDVSGGVNIGEKFYITFQRPGYCTNYPRTLVINFTKLAVKWWNFRSCVRDLDVIQYLHCFPWLICSPAARRVGMSETYPS